MEPLVAHCSRQRRVRLVRAALLIALAACATSLLFTTTDLDIRAAALLHDPPQQGVGRWTYDAEPVVRWLYRYGPYPGFALAFGCVLAGMIGWCRGCWPRAQRAALFLVLVLVLGPGLVVNGIGKEQCGRPRPREIVAFGGVQAYVPPAAIQVGARGHAFPCGHASLGFALGTALGIVWWRRRRVWAWASFAGGVLYGSALGVARMCAGAHFLSDVLWAAYLPALIALVLWWWLGETAPPPVTLSTLPRSPALLDSAA